MNQIEVRRAALARRLGVAEDQLQPLAEEGVGSRFELQPGGFYQVYSCDEEKQAFKTRVPDVPFVDQVQGLDGNSYNVYLKVERGN